jgi:ABC-type multidrug transport system fused ATPase/permease subunit
MRGAIWPVFSILFSNMFALFSQPNDPDMQQKADLYSLFFLVIAIVGFVTIGGSNTLFEWIGERMARRLRSASFKAILSQEMAFFDEEGHGTGALISRLAVDASQTHSLVSEVFRTVTSISATMIIGLVIAFVHGWQLTLVILGIIPLLGTAQRWEMKLLFGFGDKVYIIRAAHMCSFSRSISISYTHVFRFLRGQEGVRRIGTNCR